MKINPTDVAFATHLLALLKLIKVGTFPDESHKDKVVTEVLDYYGMKPSVLDTLDG